MSTKTPAIDIEASVDDDQLTFGNSLSISFQKTLRIPDDGRVYPLPPSLGNFPISKVEDYASKVPKKWVDRGGFFIPMYQREALWLSFGAQPDLPLAVKIGAGKINAISGQSWKTTLASEQLIPTEKSEANDMNDEDDYYEEDYECDYLVVPQQPWLDGFNIGSGVIRQFVAMPLGMGYTVEGQLTGEEHFGGMQIVVYPPKSLEQIATFHEKYGPPGLVLSSPEMGLAAGGKMEQKIYPDPYGLDCWDQDTKVSTWVHIVDSMSYKEITGNDPPLSPISVQTYTEYGLPWFELYDEDKQTLEATEKLKRIKSVKEKDQEEFGQTLQDDSTIEVKSKVVVGKVE